MVFTRSISRPVADFPESNAAAQSDRDTLHAALTIRSVQDRWRRLSISISRHLPWQRMPHASESHQFDGCIAPKRRNGAWSVTETTSPIR